MSDHSLVEVELLRFFKGNAQKYFEKKKLSLLKKVTKSLKAFFKQGKKIFGLTYSYS